MASQVRKKSSIRTKVNRLFVNKLGFESPDLVPLVERDYGLMRIVNDKTSTPYPRASVGVDAETLRARLEEERKSCIKFTNAEQSEMSVAANSSIHFNNEDIIKGWHADKMAMGTPHPIKGFAINPKLLRKHLDGIDWGDRAASQQWSSIKRLSDLQTLFKDVDMEPKSMKSFISLRSQSTFPSCLKMGSRTNNNVVNRKKKVTIISPRRSSTILPSDRGVRTYSTDSKKPTDSENSLSFERRRQLFNEAEFTIAMNGKKMSDHLMAEPTESLGIDETLSKADQKASEDIEKFIRRQGLIKAQAGTLHGTSKLKTNASMTSLISSGTITSIATVKRKSTKKTLFIREQARGL